MASCGFMKLWSIPAIQSFHFHLAILSSIFLRIFGINVIYVEKKLSSRFNMDTDGIPDLEYLKRSILGGRQYCLKEPLTTLPKARRQLKV